jgi:hypothetical protein
MITLLVLGVPAEADVPGNSAPLFAADDILDVTIQAPFARIMRERLKEEDTPAVLTYETADEGAVSLEIGIRTRGNYRNQWRVCPFAPLRLNFKKATVKDTVFAGTDKIKLVTHCRSGPKSFQQTLLREYLAYRLLNIMTDNSYRVRLLRVQYVDTDDGDTNADNFAFLIEHRDQLANRVGLAASDVDSVLAADLEPVNTNLGSVFQYLIGNTDFSPVAGAKNEPCCHNYTILGSEAGTILAVPYDFDMSGWVNATYATPNPKLRLRNVRQRLYRGRCENNAQLVTSLRAFRDKQPEIVKLIAELAPLANSTRKQLTRYMNDFYEIIEDPKAVESRLVAACIS